MEPRKHTLREKIQKLRLTFLGKVPETVRQGRDLGARLMRSPKEASTLDDLYRIFHSIKGTAASFGLGEISAKGGAGEEVILAFRALDEDARLRSIAATVTEMQSLLAQVQDMAAEALDSENLLTGLTPAFDLRQAGGDDDAPRKRIYMCDDDEPAAETLIIQLKCFGYGVVNFTSPDALRAAVLSNPPDAVIMDIMFPDGGHTGTETVASLRREMPNPPPVIFISGRRDFDARLRAVMSGGQAYFVKPVRAIELVDTLDGMTSRNEPEPYRILVVDDEPEVAEYHSLILEEAGMITSLLHEPSGILDALAAFRPDLVLMDMYMPKCTGRDLSRLIRQIPDFISLPIVFLSSETNKVTQVSAMRVGAEAFLTKPIQPEDLISAVAIRAERMRTLRSLMVRDGLTGLFNHTFIAQYLETSLAAARRENGKLCVVMIDVDLFKSVNDTYGHPAGDQVLVALARLLQQRLRTNDLIGRYGGEEFVIIMQNVSLKESLTIVNGLREDFARLKFQCGDQFFSCTFSGGIARFPEIAGDRLMEAADKALYEAKQTGRNRIELASLGPLP
ncbi:Pole remodelling regulatory diguanylate cyclase [Paramagnetospirillum magnetotacticum MS-1]|uniref:diguanylate cyclase n=1 Tax=Paramagnetospirillum magnetotacticum MS-1 TaxID=272627 RepID=A0A0C2V5G0_PARME|nr:response regulator [Paramagnetospirillum magnetotacticum]KIM00307.1 Pole remodelling regulatory diguanylate cyclase [Paramagnetospirillum magnetotacticum MS-1]